MIHAKVQSLIQREYAEQRSEEWLKLRENMITASDVASVLGISRFETPQSILYKKCGFQKKYSQRSQDAMSHGVQYESQARDLYCSVTGEVVHEIGLVQHPDYPFIGASPDGITESGKLIEIKCPTGQFRKKIPDYYYPQVQLCMEVLDLDECVYIEFKPPDKMVTFEIQRDRQWFTDNLPKMREFWETVLERRTRPLCEIEYE